MNQLLHKKFAEAKELFKMQFKMRIKLYAFVNSIRFLPAWNLDSFTHDSHTTKNKIVHHSFAGKILCWSLMLLLIAYSSCKKNDDVTAPEAKFPPAISLTNEIIVTTLGSDFYMEADLYDSVGIKSFTLRYDDWYLYNTVSLQDSGYPHAYHLKYKFRMPDTAANKIHSIDLMVANLGNKETSAQFKVMLNTDFPKMYITESLDPIVLTNDLFGVPQLVDKTSSYNYSATYYSAQPDTKIWFIPSKTSATPFAYGLDAKDASKLSGDANSAQPMTLAERGYYSINYNTFNLTYSVTKLSDPDPASAFPQVALAGRGFYDYPNMNWQNALPDIILLDKDPINPYLFTKTIKLGIPPGQTYNTAQFIFTTNNGWTNFWRFDDGFEPEATVFNGGNTGDGFSISNTPVIYKVTFDTYINRAKFERQ